MLFQIIENKFPLIVHQEGQWKSFPCQWFIPDKILINVRYYIILYLKFKFSSQTVLFVPRDNVIFRGVTSRVPGSDKLNLYHVTSRENYTHRLKAIKNSATAATFPTLFSKWFN